MNPVLLHLLLVWYIANWYSLDSVSFNAQRWITGRTWTGRGRTGFGSEPYHLGALRSWWLLKHDWCLGFLTCLSNGHQNMVCSITLCSRILLAEPDKASLPLLLKQYNRQIFTLHGINKDCKQMSFEKTSIHRHFWLWKCIEFWNCWSEKRTALFS